MHTVALSGTTHTLWISAIVVGFVVVLAVAGLLSMLILYVQRIDRRVVTVRDTLKAAAANTADAELIPQVAGGVQAIAQLTSPVPERLTSVNASLKPVRDFCETV